MQEKLENVFGQFSFVKLKWGVIKEPMQCANASSDKCMKTDKISPENAGHTVILLD